MFELDAADFYKVRPLFETLMAYQMFCAGVLAGLYPGRVFVDDSRNPERGLVVKDGVWWFLAGDPYNATFNNALNAAFFDRTISGEKDWGGMLVCHPADWDTQLPALYAPHIPITTKRLHYTCRQMRVDWRAQIPDGFELRFVDQSLVEDGVEVHGAAATVLQLRRDTPEPDHKAVGFVALHDRKIVASSVIDCIVNQGGDIGLYTDGAFRRRGLAYLTAAAVIEYALAHGVKVVHWDCESFNTGSIRTAEKLGLQFDHAHTMYRLILNPVLHEVNRAWSHLDAGDYTQTMAVCQGQIKAGSAPAHPHFYYVLARCYNETGKPDEVIHTLELAAQAGWDSVDEMQADFPALANHPAWPGLVGQIHKNAGGNAQ
jgi:RimJ/RimL family protein N-acetyltransferase